MATDIRISRSVIGSDVENGRIGAILVGVSKCSHLHITKWAVSPKKG